MKEKNMEVGELTDRSTIWRRAPRPNYGQNIDLKFPYSETPFLGDYKTYTFKEINGRVFINIVDFWGEGRIVTSDNLISGFTDAYNINHQYQLVSNGPDDNRKIPNRIPTRDYNDVSVKKFIDDGIVNTVTLMGAPITISAAKEIARMVRKDSGKIIIYGFGENDPYTKDLENELKKIGFFHHPSYVLSYPFDEINISNLVRVYVNIHRLTNEITMAVDSEQYTKSVTMIQVLQKHGVQSAINTIVKEASKSYKIFPFGYSLLTNADTATIVADYFPAAVRAIVTGQKAVIITNKRFGMPLKLGWQSDSEDDRTAYGGSTDRGIEPDNKDRFYWELKPVSGGSYFVITNKRFGMPLKLGWQSDSEDDRTAYGGSTDRGIEPDNKDRFYWRLNPVENDSCFTILNKQFEMPLKLGWHSDSEDDRTAYGGSKDRGVEFDNKDRFYWIITETD